MATEWLLNSLLFLLPFSLFSQKKIDNDYLKKLEDKKGFALVAQGIGLQTFIDDLAGSAEQDSIYGLTNDSRVWGVDVLVQYYLDPNWIVGIGTGMEQLSQPKIRYYLYIL